MRVEIAFGTAERQILITLEVEEGSTANQVRQAAAAREAFAGIPLESLAMGVFGRPVDDDAVLKPGERLDLYRPLTMDPQAARPRRAQRSSS